MLTQAVSLAGAAMILAAYLASELTRAAEHGIAAGEMGTALRGLPPHALQGGRYLLLTGEDGKVAVSEGEVDYSS